MQQQAHRHAHAPAWAARRLVVALLAAAVVCCVATGALNFPSLLRTARQHSVQPTSGGRDAQGSQLQHARQQLPPPQCGARVAAFPTNFWLVKVHKTGGSTLAGVLMAVAAHYGVHPLEIVTSKDKELPSFNRTVHAALGVLLPSTPLGVCRHLPYDDAKARLFPTDRGPLLRFTAVRHPLTRFYSFWFQKRCYKASIRLGLVKERGWACDTNDDVLSGAQASDTLTGRWHYARRHTPNEQYEYVRGNTSTVAAAAAVYDFIFVTERMNEALVVFMLKYGLTFEDVAYLPAKNRTGKYKAAADMPDALNSFVLRRNALDMQLWQLANQRLDRERAALQRQCGAGAVAGALRAFEQLLRRVQQQCGDFKAWHERNGLAGPYAFMKDMGRGFRCVQHVARHFAGA